MEYKEIIKNIKPELDKTIAYLEREMLKYHAGRATPSLVEDVVVECFGQHFPLKQLASISVPEPKQILIQPWDKTYIPGIVSSLEKTGVGANPIVDSDYIRINLPPITDDYRKQLLRIITEKREEVRETIRRWRDDVWSDIQKKEREGEIREDDKFRAKDELQKIVDEYNKKIEDIIEKKKKEIEL